MPLRGRETLLIVDGSEIQKLDFRFLVESSLSKEPNTAQIRVWNMSEDRRQKIASKRSVPVVLQTAYSEEANSFWTLFQGRVTKPESERSGVDWVTTLMTDDGGQAMRSARTNISFNPGTTIQKVVETLIDNTNLGEGNAKKVFNQATYKNAAKELIAGGVIQGNVMSILQKYANSAGIELSVQNEELLALRTNEARSDLESVVLSGKTGLVGSATYTSDGINCTALLLPQLVPGRRIKHRDQLYRIDVARYNGSTFENDWYAELECRAL